MFAQLYVVPLFEAALHITDEMLANTKKILFPDNKDAYEDAKKDMGITISDNGRQRYSCRGSRLIFNNICPLLVKHDGSIVCACQTGQQYGECGHENYVRYLKLDKRRDEFCPMKSLTETNKKKEEGRPWRASKDSSGACGQIHNGRYKRSRQGTPSKA